MKRQITLLPGDEVIIDFLNDSHHELIIKSYEITNLVKVSHTSDANRGEERLTYWFTPNENPNG
jgi:hypothetical protein